MSKIKTRVCRKCAGEVNAMSAYKSGACEPAAAHTPGPWKEFEDATGHDIIENDGNHVARIEKTNQKSLEHARLIAAAPDLLAACQLALTEYESTGCEHDPASNPDPQHCACCAIQSAITKATS